MDNPESEQSRRRQQYNTGVARGDRLANNSLDTCLVGLVAHSTLLLVAVPIQTYEIFAKVENPILAGSLSLAAYLAEYFCVNAILKLLANENVM